MSDELTNDQIALLCDIGEFDPEDKVADDKTHDLNFLISAGYAEASGSPPASGFKLTAKAVAFLGKRGVGLNEA